MSRDINLESHFEIPEATVITGVRRCGKSTLLRQLAQKLKDQFAIHYLNFEEQRLSYFNVNDFQIAYEEFLLNAPAETKQVLIYDEIQLVEGWERWVSGLSSRKNLGSILASQNTRLLNQSSVARDVGIKSVLTVRKFCDYFQETFLYKELRMFSRSRRSQTRSRSKFYAVDPLLAAQTGYHHTNSQYWILENHVCNELLRRGYEVFYWHSKRGYEVDFIARKKTGKILAAQVAIDLADSSTFNRECRGLEFAREELKIEDLIIITKNEPDTKTLAATTIPIGTESSHWEKYSLACF